MASYPTIQISPNMFLILDPGFGVFDRIIVPELLRSVDVHFSEALGCAPFSSTMCIISYTPGKVPKCCSFNGVHHIFLNCQRDYWCQWVFQFAHEYCHHLVNGGLEGGIDGVKWFEETVCEVASMYHLRRMIADWTHSRQKVKTRYIPMVRKYLNDLLNARESTSSCILHQSGLEEWIKWYTLCYKQGTRPASNQLAVEMLPVFEANPHLWKIIRYFGNMGQRYSLDELLRHLRGADLSYEVPLGKLQNLLCSLY